MRRLVAAAAALLCCPVAPAAGASDPASSAPDARTHAGAPSRNNPPGGHTRRRDRPNRSADRGVDDDQLTVTIKKLGSTYLERGEPVKIRARVTNTTDQAWTSVQGYIVRNTTPLTDRDSVEDFADSPTETYSGTRISSFRDLTRIGSLDVGESKSFTVKVPFKRLDLAPTNGVYEFGVHVLGTDEEKLRDSEADGRARTLLPYLDEHTASKDPIEVSMVWPFTTTVRRSADGSYPDAETLVEDISPSGRLGRLLNAARRAPPRTITLLLDPALLEALSAIARDSYGAPEAKSQPASLRADETSDSTDSPQRLANAYLSRLRALAKSQDVWMTPYARPDLDALAGHHPAPAGEAVYQASERAARSVLDRFGVKGRVAYLPADGIAAPESLQWAQSNTDTDASARPPAAVLSPQMLHHWDEADSPLTSLDVDGQSIPTVVDDGTVMSGGPLPGRTDSALQVRQRLASEATLRAMERAAGASTSKKIAVVVDPEWDPGRGSRRVNLFDVLEATWVRPISPDRRLGRAEDWHGGIGVPDPEDSETLADAQVDAAAKVVRDASDLASMVEGSAALEAYYGGSASMVVSQNWRDDPVGAESYADEQAAAAGGQLDDVTIQGPGFVSFSGNSGKVPVTIHNGLDVPISVGVTLKAEGRQLSVPNMPAETIQPGQSPSFTIDADIGEVSNTAFKATLTTPEGDTFGKPAEFNVRSSVVGTAIWIGMGVAGLLVVLALVRQIRRRRATAALAGEAEQ